VDKHNVYHLLNKVTKRNIKPSTPNDPYSGRTATLTSKRCILYIYSTNTGTEYFKHGIQSPFFFFSLSSKRSLFHNSNVFGSCIIHVLRVHIILTCRTYWCCLHLLKTYLNELGDRGSSVVKVLC